MMKFVYLFSKKQPLCPENCVQTWRGHWRSFDLQIICSKYRPETWLAPSALATNLAGNCFEKWRATSDVRIYDFDIQLNCAGNGLQTWLATTQEWRTWRSICEKM